ncbi:ArfGAP with FG repeats 1 [Podila clonocystis]|nr:ArfGAP with FG repeats 1 [Podila clonocystis]
MDLSSRASSLPFRILTSLLKLPENKKCFDCPSKVNVYVNLFNSTFICEKCSGLHREFNHRVKSISASTFTPEEVASLQKGGNAVAKKVWLATWSWREYPEPDAHEVDELKQFMRAKYVKKLWYQDPNGGGSGGDQVETQLNTINHNHNGASTPSTPSTPLTPTASTPGVRAHNQIIDSLTMAPERNLSRKSSTISSDSGSTTMSKVTDLSSNSINAQRQTPGSTHHHTSSPRLQQTQQTQQVQQLQQQASFDNFMGLMNNSGSTDYTSGSSLGPAFAVTSPSGADPFSLMTNAFSTMNVNSSQITSPEQQTRPQVSQTSSMSSNDFFAAFSTPAVSTPVPLTAGATPDPFSLMSPTVPQQYSGQLTPQGQSSYSFEPLSTTLSPAGSKSFDDYLSMLGQGKQQQQDAFSTMSQGSYNTPSPSMASSNYNSLVTPVSLSPQPTGVSNPFGQPTGSSPFPGGLQRAFTSDYPLSSPFGGNNAVSAPSVGNSSNSNPFATFAKQQPAPSNVQHQNAAINNSYLSDPFGANSRSPQPVMGGQDYFSGSSMSSNAFGSQPMKSPNPFAMGGSGSGLESAFDEPQVSQHLQFQQPAFVRSMSDSNFSLQTSNQSPFGLPASPSPNSASYQYSNGSIGSYAFSSPSRSMTLPAPSASGPSHSNNSAAMNEMFGQWMQPSPKNPTSKYPSIDDLDPFSTTAGGVSSSNNQFSNPFSL